jgi:hypothetical protein
MDEAHALSLHHEILAVNTAKKNYRVLTEHDVARGGFLSPQECGTRGRRDRGDRDV